jgi:two-component system LytT family response regulator
MIKTLIVDDEPLARRHIAAMLRARSDFEVVGEAAHGASAIAQIEAARPDVVFLDVQMPEVTGFDVVEAIGVEAMPITVFVTAHDAFAVRAFEVQAIDYLLKPFGDDRFAQVLERVRRQMAAGHGRAGALATLLASAPRTPRLVARGNGVARIIPLEDVQWIGAAGNYAEVHTAGRSLLIDESIASLAARLPAQDFARIHRAVIVRLDAIAEVRGGSHGDGAARLTSGVELRISRRYREAVQAYLSACLERGDHRGVIASGTV